MYVIHNYDTINLIVTTAVFDDVLANTPEGYTITEIDDVNPECISIVEGNVVIRSQYRIESAKSVKIAEISRLTVETANGKVFDGDETSQGRMLRAISIADITGETTTEWKLADNSVAIVTLDELKEALTLAGREMSNIWLKE